MTETEMPFGFPFSGRTGKPKSATRVRVYKGDSLHHVIAAETGNNINGSWMTHLFKGEEIHLKVTVGKLFASSNVPVIFTGNLLKLDDLKEDVPVLDVPVLVETKHSTKTKGRFGLILLSK